MKILQISTYDISGGAARAAYRLQKGLREIGHDCRMLVKHKNTEDAYVHKISSESTGEDILREFFLNRVIQEHYIQNHRTEKSNTFFSIPYPGFDLTRIPALNETDIINLHWVAQYQSLSTLQKLCSLKKPVVWTLHDQSAFTGGCHYGAGCEKYRSDCSRCPQLSGNLQALPEAVLKDKLSFFKGLDITFVTPSRWMGDCLKKSRLFRDRRIEVIPNSLETDIFSPLPKEEARQILGLEKDIVTILFGGEDASEKRKGFSELVSAIQFLSEKSEFKKLIETKKVYLLCFGRPSKLLASVGIPVVALGYLCSDSEIRNAYCAADVFVLPSLEDNLPNTVLEAMSCGTPVVGFDMGGMPDMVQDGITGRLVPVGDSRQLGEALLSILLDSNRRKQMGGKCREIVENEYPLRVQALGYSEFYEELISENASKSPSKGANEAEAEAECFGENLIFPASFDSDLGPHFEKVYEKILFSALKEAAFQINQKWQVAETDRVARFKVIQEQGDRIVKLEAEVDRWLNESRQLQERVADLVSRQHDLKSRYEALESRYEKLENKCRHQENEYMAETKLLQSHIAEIEADRVARLQVINDQGEQIGALKAEVDRLLNENSQLLNENSQLSIEAEKIIPKKALRKISHLPRNLMENLSVLREIKDNRLAYFVTLKKILKGVPEDTAEPAVENREKPTSHVPLASLRKRIDEFNASQPNRDLLDSIRQFNHSMVDQFNHIFPLKGCTFLEIGASPHGYALERALSSGVAFYAGVGLDIEKNEYVMGESGNTGMLLNMDATDLRFPDDMFDAVFSISVFEHVSHVSRALAEIKRLLKPGGSAFISFEPVWSCSYGHHLHHFGECAGLIPPWGHLIWSPDQMRDHLSQKWPVNPPLSLDEAIDWIYAGKSINRLNIRQFKTLFDDCGLSVSWRTDLKDAKEKLDPVLIRKAAEATGLDSDELMTKGLCVLLTKEP
jgi:glycosyltransferase involved in cell wall biosynthesis/SAM-dependent methyltransferase